MSESSVSMQITKDFPTICFLFTGSIEGKRVVITGASTGIGEQIAYQYAKLGAKILITARREGALQEVGDFIPGGCLKAIIHF